MPKPDGDKVIDFTLEEVQAAAQRELGKLDLTYDQLADQAKHRDFESAQANSLWVAIGGTIGL